MQAASTEVGVLYVVYEHRLRSNTKKTARLPAYLAEAAASARRIRTLNPALPVALSTTQTALLPRSLVAAFDRVLPLAAAAASEPLWGPRLRALAASPFGLTLALDSHATACSDELHAALLAEARRRGARYDLATNVEATECLPHAKGSAGLGRLYFPRHAGQLYPHNFAVLLRKGAGLDALLRLWMGALARMQRQRATPDDQWALACVPCSRASARSRAPHGGPDERDVC